MTIETLLASAGYTPIRPTATGAMYRAEYRGDCNASLSINYGKNLWYDFGAATGGDVADLYCLIYGCSIGDALRAIRNGESSIAPTVPKVPQTAKECPIKVTAHREIRQTDATAKYLMNQRGLTYWAHLYHVNYMNAGKPFFGIGWLAIDGGWHIRSLGKAKFCTSQQISSIRHGSSSLLIFEGILDYLSLCQMFPAYRSYDAVILNSVTNVNKSIGVAQEYKEVHLLLDNDLAGDTSTANLMGALPQAKDDRSFFAPYNDINEYLQHKLNLKTQLTWKRQD